MRLKPFVLAGALASSFVLAMPLRADVQARVNVVAHALASARHIQLSQVAVGGFAEADNGQRPPFAQTLEADLRTALTRYGADWTVLGADADSASADALVTGTFERDGSNVDVHVQVVAQPEGTVLWQRDTVLDGSDVSDADLAAASGGSVSGADAEGGETVPSAEAGNTVPGASADLGGDEGQMVPTLPYSERYSGYGWNSDFDLNVAYKAFFPTNSSFRRAAGSTMNAFSLGVSFDDVFLADMDFWQQDVSTLGTAQSLDYAGTDLALVVPFHFFDRHLCLYVGPGGRFGEITVNDPALDEGGVGFGNNALEAVAGVKWKADNVGLDLRYTYDLAYSYTGYNTLRLGAFYEFGN